MGLFSRKEEPVQRPRLTVNDRPQTTPEQPGSIQRRARLFYECMRRISSDPLASPAAIGRPVADGIGLEGLVATITPLFKNEQSLLPWVALRGALTQLYLLTIDDKSLAAPFYPTVERAMGVGHVGTSPDDPTIDVGPDWRGRLNPEQRQAATGIFCAVGIRAHDYARYSTMTINEVVVDPCWLGHAVALDVVAWSSVALLRLQIMDMSVIPEPDKLEQPGWYCDPLWGKGQRYWDGNDWTARCRTTDGRSPSEVSQPLA